MKRLLKKLLPQKIFSIYHFGLAILGTVIYGLPGRSMVIIGVTGTKGKTSAANFIWAVLQSCGFKTGIITTANIRIGDKEVLNKYHMTMPGRFVIQRLLADMKKAGCTHVVVETTSEGIKQFRHVGVFYDIAVFTNLTPEHLESHSGSFEEYRRMKGKLFESLNVGTRKKVLGKTVKKVSVVNADDKNSDFFLNFPADEKITFGLEPARDFRAEDIEETARGVWFNVAGEKYFIEIIGAFNVLNALPAVAIAKLFGADKEGIQKGFDSLKVIPGRMEFIEAGQPFKVIVDYAHEKESMTKALETARKIAGNKVIVLLGAEGGGRDKSKRALMGEVAAKLADLLVISNVDPYDDDPWQIIKDIEKGIQETGCVDQVVYEMIPDRREGIRKALSLANPGDVVIITGKGAEQSIVEKGIRTPWDDRTVVREELRTNYKE